MNIQGLGLSKKAQSIVSDIDIFIHAYEKAKGAKPERVALNFEEYDLVYKSVSRLAKYSPDSIERNGVIIYKR